MAEHDRAPICLNRQNPHRIPAVDHDVPDVEQGVRGDEGEDAGNSGVLPLETPKVVSRGRDEMELKLLTRHPFYRGGTGQYGPGTTGSP